MKGNAYIIYYHLGSSTHFRDVKLTVIGSEGHASITRERDSEDPEELLCMEAVQVDVLNNTSIDLEGFARRQDGQYFRRCSVRFELFFDGFPPRDD